MPILDDLADYLTNETAMTVHEAVLVMWSKDALPKVKLFTEGVTVHAVFRTPAGLFMCEMTNVGKDPFFSELEQGHIDVGEAVRLDLKQDFTIENNWPARKVQIDGTYYAMPRNFARHFQHLVEQAQAQAKKKRRR